MASRYTGVLSPAQALDGMECCVLNAQELLDEAQILIESGRHARAIALSLIAWEEMGKLPMLAGSARYLSDPNQWKKRFWRRFRSHREKLRMHETVFPLEDGGPAQHAGFVWDELSAVRERMLYTDFEGGSFRLPSSMPRADKVAPRLVRALRDAVEFHRQLHSSMTPEKLDIIGRLTPKMFAAAREALEEHGVRTQDISDLEILGALKAAGLDAKRIWEEVKASAEDDGSVGQ